MLEQLRQLHVSRRSLVGVKLTSDAETRALIKRVVASVIASPLHGDKSALYRAMGYVPANERKTRKWSSGEGSGGAAPKAESGNREIAAQSAAQMGDSGSVEETAIVTVPAQIRRSAEPAFLPSVPALPFFPAEEIPPGGNRARPRPWRLSPWIESPEPIHIAQRFLAKELSPHNAAIMFANQMKNPRRAFFLVLEALTALLPFYILFEIITGQEGWAMDTFGKVAFFSFPMGVGGLIVWMLKYFDQERRLVKAGLWSFLILLGIFVCLFCGLLLTSPGLQE